MRDYELAFIVEPNIDDEGVTGVVDKVSQFVQTIDGSVASVDVWGRKTLAYPINNHREGTYVLLQTKISPASLDDLERNLKLSEEIIRYLLIKAES
jgi:small subunit ribosomal protein S6